MIYHEVAIKPESIEDLKDFSLIEKMFGYEHGRLIAVVPDPKKGNGENWISLLFQHLKEIAPGKVKQIQLRLEKLQNSATIQTRKKSVIDTTAGWLVAAEALHQVKEFQALLSDDCEEKEPPFFPFQGLHDPPEGFPEFLKNPIHVTDCPKDPGVFLAELTPLISTAKKLHFIDPYFNPAGDHQWKNMVRDLSKFLKDANRTRVEVNFHGKLPDGDNDAVAYVNAVKTEIEAWFPIQTDLSFSAWSQKAGGQRLHARYLLTDKGGASFEYGLGPMRAQRTDVSLMPKPKVAQTIEEYDPESPNLFQLEHTQRFSGCRS